MTSNDLLNNTKGFMIFSNVFIVTFI